MQAVAEHEAELTAYALEKLAGMPKIGLFGDPDPGRAAERLGVIPFEVGGMSHFLVAAILGYEFGIGVRSGCFCAHPSVLRLLGLGPEQAGQVRDRILARDKRDMPGLVRASFGLYNTPEEVDRFADALGQIVRGDYAGQYRQDPETGEFHPEGWEPRFGEYLPGLD
jgi:selenocysteine lyase/cysteine desulfurase